MLPGQLHGPVGGLGRSRPVVGWLDLAAEPDRAGRRQQVEQFGEPPRRHPNPDRELAPGQRAVQRAGHGHRGPRRERLDDRAQPQVVGPEIVAPGGDAVRLVHRDQPHRRPGQAVPHVVARQLLRSQEDESRPAAAEQRIGVLPGGPAGQPVDRHRAQAAGPQRVRLLPLQRQQRGHHDHRAAQGDRRDLVDRRLPGAAGQHDQAVAAGGQRGRGLHLRRPQDGQAQNITGDLANPCPGLLAAFHQPARRLPPRPRSATPASGSYFSRLSAAARQGSTCARSATASASW
jgi:hypothetical protein